MADYSSYAPKDTSFATFAGMSPEEEALLQQRLRGDDGNTRMLSLAGGAEAGQQRRQGQFGQYLDYLAQGNHRRADFMNAAIRANLREAQINATGRSSGALKDSGLQGILTHNLADADLPPELSGMYLRNALQNDQAQRAAEGGAGAQGAANAGLYTNPKDLTDLTGLGYENGVPVSVRARAAGASSGGAKPKIVTHIAGKNGNLMDITSYDPAQIDAGYAQTPGGTGGGQVTYNAPPSNATGATNGVTADQLSEQSKSDIKKYVQQYGAMGYTAKNLRFTSDGQIAVDFYDKKGNWVGTKHIAQDENDTSEQIQPQDETDTADQ